MVESFPFRKISTCFSTTTHFSDASSVEDGVPQGSVLTTLLFYYPVPLGHMVHWFVVAFRRRADHLQIHMPLPAGNASDSAELKSQLSQVKTD